MRILEEFWYGNIEPTEYDTSSKEYKKLQELICRNEEKLKATMTNEQKAILKKYAKEQGFQNIQFFVDDGYSGANFAEVR